MRGLPGVADASLASMDPMDGFSFMDYVTDDTPAASAPAHWNPIVTAVSPNYFAATGLRLVEGSGFATVTGNAPAEVVVNQTMAKGQWPNRNAIGQCMRFKDASAPCYRVVGVVEDSRMSSVLETPVPQYYIPLGNVPAEAAGFLRGYYVVARADPRHMADITAAARALIRREFPGAIPDITWLSEHIEPQYRPWKLGAALFTAFGVLALVVAVIGIYSTVSYGVNQRIHEFGVRIALGAQLSDVLRLVVVRGLRAVAAGVGLGVALALLAGRFIASLLYGVTPSDPVALATVAAALLIVSAMAALIPAWRAARVDPVSALRSD
jgi:hypothetical protein